MTSGKIIVKSTLLAASEDNSVYRTCFRCLVVLGLLWAPSAAWAQSGTWTNAAGGNWSTPSNWSLNTVANGAGNTANFNTLNIGADVTVTLDTPRTIGNLMFGDTAPSNNWFLSGANTLTLSGGTPTITVNNQAATIGTPITATGGYTKSGAGTLNVTQLNTLNGQTLTVTGGLFQILASDYNRLSGGGNASLAIGEGATISAANPTQRNAHNINNVTLTGGTLTSSGASHDGFGNWLINGNVTTNASNLSSVISAALVSLQSATTFTVADGAAAVDLLVSSQLFNGSLVKDGAGLMQLSGNNIYTGTTTINAGTLSIDAENRLGSSAGALLTLNGGTLQTTASFTIDDAGRSITVGTLGGTIETAGGTTLTLAKAITSTAGDFFKRGTGTLDLTVNGSSFSGRTLNVMEGTMRVVGTTYNMLGFSQNIFIGEGASLVAANTSQNAHNFNALTMTGGTLTSSGAASEGGFGHFLLNADVTTNASATTSTISAGRVSLQGVSRIFTVADGAAAVDLLVSSELFNGGLIKNGAGLMQLSGSNTYTGTTTINAGTLSIDAENRLGSSAGALLTLNGGTLQTTASFTIDDAGRSITVGTLGGAIETTGGTTLTVARTITSTAGAAGLKKTGAGTMNLTVTNNFTGSTLTVDDGIVNISAVQTLTGGNVVVNSGTLNLASASTFNLLGGNPNIFIGQGATVSAANTVGSNAHNIGSVTMTGGTLTSNATSDAANGHWLINGNSITTNASALQSNITTGSVNLRGITTFTVAEGAAAIDLFVSSRLFNGDLTKAGPGWMQLTSSTNAFAGRIVKVDGGTLELKAVNDVSGGNVIVNSGLLRLSGNIFNQLGLGTFADVTIGAGGTVDAASTSQNAHNIGALSLAGGTLTSSGAADFGNGNFLLRRDVTVNGAVQSTISATAVNLTSGTRNFNVADGAAPVDLLVSSFLFGGGFVKSGAGTMNLSTPGSFSGQTINVGAGRLNLAGSAFNILGGGANVVVGEGAIISAENTTNNAHNINTLTLTGGTLTSNGVDNVAFGNWLLNGNVTTNASALQSNISAVRISLQGTRTFNVADGTASVDLAVSSIVFNGSLVKEGDGLMSLSGVNNFYSGTTTINDGALRVDGQHNNAGSYTVVSGATLGGSGIINLAPGASINVLPTPGIVSPGPGFSGTDPANIGDVGTLTINAANAASLALDMNGILQIDIVSATQHDVLDIATGTIDIDPAAVININGHTNLSLLDLDALGIVEGDRITLLMADQIIGNFSNFFANQEISAVGGKLFLGNDGTSLFLLATPEPASVVMWVLLGTVGVCFVWQTRRARGASQCK